MATKKTEAQKNGSLGTFYSDIVTKKMLYGLLVRSPTSGKKLKSVSVPELDEGYFLVTAKDIPGKNNISTFQYDFPILFDDFISYVGAPVAILVGKETSELLNLSKKVIFEFEDCEIEETNPVLAKRTFSFGNVQEVFSQIEQEKSGQTFFSEYNMYIPLDIYHETCGAFADYKKDSLYVASPTQWTSHLRKNLSKEFDIKKDQITIEKTTTYLSDTSIIWNNTVIACQAALASYVCGVPVLLSLTREEQKRFVNQPIPIKVTQNAAFTEDGYMTANHISISVESGIFNPFVESLLTRLISVSFGAYRTQNLLVEAVAFKTDSPPTVANMGASDLFVFFPLECYMQSLAKLLCINPIEFRLKTLFPASSYAKVKSSITFDTSPIFNIFDDVAKRSDFNRKYTAYIHNPVDPNKAFSSIPFKSIGFASAFDGIGFYSSQFEILKQTVGLTLDTDGSVTIHAHKPSNSILNIWKSLISDELEVPVENINIDSSFDVIEEPEFPESVTGNISVIPQLLKKCCTSIQKARFREPLPISAKKKLTKPKTEVWNAETFTGRPFFALSYGACVVEIEVDPILFSVKVLGIWISLDVGKILSKKQAELSVLRNVEEVLTTLISGSLLYTKNISVNFIESESEPKQIGEIVNNILPAAFVNAVSLALGKNITKLPLSGDTIYQGITAE